MPPGGRLLPQRGDWVLGCRLDDRLSQRPGASVWRAWRPAEARDVAVKVLHRDEAHAITARHLRRSGQVLRALDPPHGAEVLDAGELGEHLVLVSRLVPGVELGRRVHRDGWWTPRRAVNAVSQLATCLDSVHRAGIVHGALNPHNVRLAGVGGTESVHLVDLGLPRRVREVETDQMSLPGLWAEDGAEALAGLDRFRAPEVLLGEQAGVASDVFGLAALLHLMISGVAPGLPQLVTGRVYDERSRLLALAAQGLAESPADRPASVHALADAAQMALDEAPTPGWRSASTTASGRPLEQPVVTHVDLTEESVGGTSSRPGASRPRSVPAASARPSEQPARSEHSERTKRQRTDVTEPGPAVRRGLAAQVGRFLGTDGRPPAPTRLPLVAVTPPAPRPTVVQAAETETEGRPAGVSPAVPVAPTPAAPAPVAPAPADDDAGPVDQAVPADHELDLRSRRPRADRSVTSDDGDRDVRDDHRRDEPAAVVPRRTVEGPRAVSAVPTLPAPRAWLSEEELEEREAAKAGRSSRLAGLVTLVVLALAVQVGALLWAARGGDDPSTVVAPAVGAPTTPQAPSAPVEPGLPVQPPEPVEPPVAPLAPAPPVSPAPPERSAADVSGVEQASWGTIRPGVLGPQVSAVQWLLFANGAGPRPDGVYDTATAQAVRDFQIANDLPATGLVDPETWGALAVPVAPGDEGPRVRALQQLLKVSQQVQVDGVYDAATADAVQAFQVDNQLQRAGSADGATWVALSRAWG